jgi:hypothetical protein
MTPPHAPRKDLAGVTCPGCVDGYVVDNHDNFPPECGACQGTGWLTKDRLIQLYHNHQQLLEEHGMKEGP